MLGKDSRDREEALGNLRWVCLYRAECHLTASRFYENVHMWVGMIAAGAGVVAGGTAFAGETTIAGLAATLSALAAGFITTHKPGERIASHAHAATAYYGLAEDTKLFVKFGWTSRDGSDPSQEEARDLEMRGEPQERPAGRADQAELGALVGFERREDQLENQSPAVPVRLCRKAEKWISTHEQWYPPDEQFTAWRERRETPQPPKRRWPFKRRGSDTVPSTSGLERDKQNATPRPS